MIRMTPLPPDHSVDAPSLEPVPILSATARKAGMIGSKADIEAQQFNQNAETLKKLKELEKSSNGNTNDEDKKALKSSKAWIEAIRQRAPQAAEQMNPASEMKKEAEFALGTLGFADAIDPLLAVRSERASARETTCRNSARV